MDRLLPVARREDEERERNVERYLEIKGELLKHPKEYFVIANGALLGRFRTLVEAFQVMKENGTTKSLVVRAPQHSGEWLGGSLERQGCFEPADWDYIIEASILNPLHDLGFQQPERCSLRSAQSSNWKKKTSRSWATGQAWNLQEKETSDQVNVERGIGKA